MRARHSPPDGPSAPSDGPDEHDVLPRDPASPAPVEVLIVEDDDDIRDCLAETLTLEGFVVAQARNGLEALEMIRVSPPRVVILDLMMPVMNGWELLNVLRSDSVLGQIPALVMTAVHNNTVQPPDAPVFLKPVNVPSLLRAVRTHVVGARG